MKSNHCSWENLSLSRRRDNLKVRLDEEKTKQWGGGVSKHTQGRVVYTQLTAGWTQNNAEALGRREVLVQCVYARYPKPNKSLYGSLGLWIWSRFRESHLEKRSQQCRCHVIRIRQALLEYHIKLMKGIIVPAQQGWCFINSLLLRQIIVTHVFPKVRWEILQQNTCKERAAHLTCRLTHVQSFWWHLHHMTLTVCACMRTWVCVWESVCLCANAIKAH